MVAPPSWFGASAAYLRYAIALPAFLRRSLSLDQARTTVQKRLTSRGELFLETVRRAAASGAASPYPELLRRAGVAVGDVERLIPDRGVEGTLTALRRAGVYVSFSEFKQRTPIIRDGREIVLGPRPFDNPTARATVEGSSSGSTGRPTRSAVDLDHARATLPSSLLGLAAHGLEAVPSAVWLPPLPSVAGLSIVLRSATRRRVAERWFTPLTAGDVRPSLKDWLAMEATLAVSRLAGVPLPRPRTVPIGEAETVARWVARALAREGRCLLHAHVSGLLRVALAARELGLDLSGAAFTGGGEPVTRAKVEPIEAVGARFIPTYYITEAGAIGLACASPADATDVHFMADSLAMITYPVNAPVATGEVDALHYTSLLPTAPKLLLNVESDDSGVLEDRECGCLLGDLGYRRHLRRVFSYGKLTGEGMSVFPDELVRALEEELPSRFGGTPLDYQLLEEEDPQGLTRLVLLVHPRVALPSEEIAVEALLDTLRGRDRGTELARAVWQDVGSLTVRREAPRLSSHGKFLSLVRAVESEKGIEWQDERKTGGNS